MGGTQIALYQSTFVGVDIGRVRPGSGGGGEIGASPQSERVSPQQAGEGPSSPSVGNLSEASGGYRTSIAGQEVQIAYPFS